MELKHIPKLELEREANACGCYAARRMSPEVPETVKEPPLAIETLQGHKCADPWRVSTYTRAHCSSRFPSRCENHRRTREKEKSRRNRHRVPHNNGGKIFSFVGYFLIRKKQRSQYLRIIITKKTNNLTANSNI